MKLRKGKSTYKLPPVGQMLHVHLNLSKRTHLIPLRALQPVQAEHITAENKKQRGTPRCFATVHGYGGTEIIFHPTPDAAMEAVVRYFPPAQEI